MVYDTDTGKMIDIFLGENRVEKLIEVALKNGYIHSREEAISNLSVSFSRRDAKIKSLIIVIDERHYNYIAAISGAAPSVNEHPSMTL